MFLTFFSVFYYLFNTQGNLDVQRRKATIERKTA